MHLLERYVIRCQKSLGEGFWGFWEHSTIFLYKLVVIAFHFTPFQLAKVFIGMLYFLIMGETCIIPSCFIDLYKMQLYEKYFFISYNSFEYIVLYNVQCSLYKNSYDKFFKDLVSDKSFLMMWHTSFY